MYIEGATIIIFFFTKYAYHLVKTKKDEVCQFYFLKLL
jgi:hypothetical protein